MLKTVGPLNFLINRKSKRTAFIGMEIICYNVNVFTVTVDLVHPCRIKVFTVFIYLLLLKKILLR